MIEAHGLVKSFRSAQALAGLDLMVPAGTTMCLLGPNGAGKTTAVRVLSTLLRPDAGWARVAGYDVVADGAAVRRHIGMSGQYASVDDCLTGRANLVMIGRLSHLARSEARRRAVSLLAALDLERAADRPVRTYSGGMRRRLDLAASLLGQPSVLFLDEPTTGLDPQSRTALWEEVARLVKEEGMTVFLTTQYLEEADVLADRVGIIDKGEIVAEDTPARLKAEIGRPTLEVDPAEGEDWSAVGSVLERFGELASAQHQGVAVRLRPGVEGLADVIRALDAAGLRVANVELHTPTLDDVFLIKTGHSLEGGGGGSDANAEA